MKLKNEITRYLKKAVLAQVDRCIDFKNDEFYKISKEEFYKGEIDPNITLKLFKNNKAEEKNTDKEKEKIDENLYIIIAVKVIRTIEEGSQKKDEETEDLTGIYFIPAMLNKEKSVLLPAIEDNKLPWFPREFLKPMIEPELAIGDNQIFEYYKEINPNNVLGIITPFKAQAVMIRNVLKQILPKEVSNKITVGTIHVLQGGERKIIIMSTTYGKDEGCFFIDNNKSLMNVAVSRAEDSFLVFGNIECLKDETTSPSGLLKSFITKMEL